MAVKLTLHPQDKAFHLPAGFQIESEFKNPIFSEQGSQSLPVNLPPTDRNARLMEHANRPDKPDKTIARRILVEDGSFRRYGKINVLEASPREGFVCNIDYDEAEFYAAVKNKSLSQLPWDEHYANRYPVMNPYFPNAASSLQYYLNLCTREPDNVELDFSLFPVALEAETLNGVKQVRLVNIQWGFPEDGVQARLWLDQTQELIANGSQNITVENPKYYGCTPFIKLHALLRLAFRMLGYTLESEPFSGDNQMQRLCLPNNTRDALINGRIKLAQLMPDCTLQELLDTLLANFGAITFFNSDTRSVRIRLLKDIFGNASAEAKQNNFTPYRSDVYKLIFEPARQLKLSAGKSIENEEFLVSAKTPTDTLDEFIEQNGDRFFMQGAYKDVEQYSLKGYVYNVSTYYQYEFSDTGTGKRSVLSSPFFDWYKPLADNAEYLELTGKNEQIPVSTVSELKLKWTALWQGTEADQFAPETYDYANGDNLLIPMFLVKARHLNSHVTIGGKSVPEESAKNKCPIAFLWAIEHLHQDNFAYGSSFVRFKNGNWYNNERGYFNFDLCFGGNTGLFKYFFSEYEAALRHALQPVETSFRLPASQLNNIRMNEALMADNQPYLIEGFKHIVGSTAPMEFRLRSLKLLQPYDLETEQFQPVPMPVDYVWKYYNDPEAEALAWIEANYPEGKLTEGTFDLYRTWGNSGSLYYTGTIRTHGIVRSVSIVSRKLITKPEGNLYPSVLPEATAESPDKIQTQTYRQELKFNVTFQIPAQFYRVAYGRPPITSSSTYYNGVQYISGYFTENFTVEIPYEVGLKKIFIR